MSATQAVLGFVHGSQCHLYYSVNSRAGAWLCWGHDGQTHSQFPGLVLTVL